MQKTYTGIEKSKKAYFSHYMGLRSKILTPVPYISKIENNKYLKSFGSFSKGEINKIGDLNKAINDNNSFFIRPNVIRYLLYCLIMGINNSFRNIFWHNEFSEYLFIDFDFPFFYKKPNKKLLDHLNVIPNELIKNELDILNKIFHCSKSMSIFNKYGYTNKIKYVLKNIDYLYSI